MNRVARGVLDCDGVWSEVVVAPPAMGRRAALFLDRDGVIVEEADYLHTLSDLRLVAGAAALIAAANRRRIAVVIVTNQSGIGRGHFGWVAFAAIQHALLRRLRAAGARIDGVFACPYHPDAQPPYAHLDHPARKPRPGMLLKAAVRLRLDLSASWIVGDTISDIQAGKAAGLAGGLHVLSGHGRTHRAAVRAIATPAYRVLTGRTLRDARRILPLIDPR